MATKEEKRADLKERGIRIGINQIVTYATLVPIFWFIAQPIIVDALAEDIKSVVQTEVSNEVTPINNAFVALLQRDINRTKREIADLEYDRDNDGENWTRADAEELADKEIELDALEEAKEALTEKDEEE